MTAFPAPYPRRTDDRRAEMERLPDDTMAMIDELIELAGVPRPASAMVRIAREAGIWPE